MEMKRHILFMLKKFMRNRNRLSGKIDNLLVRLHKNHENVDNDFFTNGEYAVLAKLANVRGLSTIFDVGANKGEWALMASGLFPQARIHSFEIVPQTFSNLLENCGYCENIICHNIGLSDEEGTTNVFFSPAESGYATCVPDFYEQFHKYRPQRVEGKVSTGDIYCAANGIETIEFLRLMLKAMNIKFSKALKGC